VISVLLAFRDRIDGWEGLIYKVKVKQVKQLIGPCRGFA